MRHTTRPWPGNPLPRPRSLMCAQRASWKAVPRCPRRPNGGGGALKGAIVVGTVGLLAGANEDSALARPPLDGRQAKVVRESK